jgi:hypothetical protein
MSNVSQDGGLRLKKMNTAGQTEVVFIPASDGTLLGIGDAVKLSASNTSGSIGQGPSKAGVTRCAAGDQIYGVIQGFLPHFSDGTGNMDLTINYRKASTAEYACIRLANNLDEYSITDDGNLASGVAGANGVANIGYNANLVVSNASTSTGLSKMQLGGASVASTATLQLKIVGVEDDVRNDPTSNNARYMVRINNANASGGTGTTGV